MSIGLIIIMLVLVYLVVYLFISFVTNSPDDFFKNIWLKTLWIWLPIHALKRLSRELRDKKFKK
jgi:hypothetical protein